MSELRGVLIDALSAKKARVNKQILDDIELVLQEEVVKIAAGLTDRDGKLYYTEFCTKIVQGI